MSKNNFVFKVISQGRSVILESFFCVATVCVVGGNFHQRQNQMTN